MGAEKEIDVNSIYHVGVVTAEPTSHGCAPITPLSVEAWVSENVHHQMSPQSRNPPWSDRFGRSRRKAITWQRGNYHIETLLGGSTIFLWAAEALDHVEKFNNGSRPTVGEDHCAAGGACASHVIEVKIHAFDASLELRKSVQGTLGGAPVIAQTPVF